MSTSEPQELSSQNNNSMHTYLCMLMLHETNFESVFHIVTKMD